ncbi:MAG: lysylphosphatidylglycerol synthase transmembrane domain-containing protein [Candidatus Eisenbacteria bacterium]
MASPSAEAVPLPSSRVLTRGIQGFFACSVAGILVGLWWKRPENLATLARHIRWDFAALLLPLLAADYVLGGLRYRLFFDGTMLPKVSLWNCMRSNWANIFLGAATPFQTGGGPAQLYILWRSGARVSDGLMISLVNFGATLIFFLVSAVAAAMLLPADFLGPNFTPALRTACVIVGGVVGLTLLTLLSPGSCLAVLRPLIRAFPWRGGRDSPLREGILRTLESGTQRFGDGFRSILHHRPWHLGVVVLVTLLLFSNKYVIGYAVARALGQEVPFGLFFGLQIIQLFLIYFAPTPGASGIAEISSMWLFATIMPADVLLVYAVLWRFTTTVLGAMIGGSVLLLEVGRTVRVE